MEDIAKIIRDNPRYSGFTILKDPVPFDEMFKDKNINTIQVHSAAIVHGYIVGFCGVFKWNDNILTPLDGDSYNKSMMVLGYEEFDGGIDILVGNDW